QSDSRAGIFSGGVQSLERTKKFAGELHAEARAIVSHKQDAPSFAHNTAEFDFSFRLLASELERVAQQVFHHETQQPVIAGRGDTRLDSPSHAAFRVGLLQFSHDVLRHLAEVDLLVSQLSARHA